MVVLAGIIALGITIRLAMGWARWGVMGDDETAYLFAGRALFRGEGLIHSHGYSLISFHPLLAILSGFFDFFIKEAEVTSDLLFAITGSLSAVPVYLIGRDLYGRNAGIIAALFTVTMPFFATGMMMYGWPIIPLGFTNTEPLAVLLVLIGGWQVYQANEKMHWRHFFGAGIFFGLAYLARPEGLIWFISMLAWLVICRIHKKNRGHVRMLARLMLMVLVMSAMMLPYIFWLHQNTGQWIISAKAGSNILSIGGGGRWPESALPELEKWEQEHPNTSLHKYSVPRFFLENPHLFLVKIRHKIPLYIPHLRTVVPDWFWLLVALHFGGVLISKAAMKRETFLLFLALPLFFLVLSNLKPRYLLYWVPLVSLWGAHVFAWLYDRRRKVCIIVITLAVAWNLRTNIKTILYTRANAPHELYRVPGRWIDAKRFPGDRSFVTNYLIGFYGGTHRFIDGVQDVEYLFSEDELTAFIACSPHSTYGNEPTRRICEDYPRKIGNKLKQTIIFADGMSTIIYQRWEGDFPLSSHQLIGRTAINGLPRILYMSQGRHGGDARVVNENLQLENIPSFARLRNEIKQRNTDEEGMSLVKVFTLVKEKKLIFSKLENWTYKAKNTFRNNLRNRAKVKDSWIVIDDPSGYFKGLKSLDVPLEFEIPAEEEEFLPPTDDGRVVYFDLDGKGAAWVNLSRMVVKMDMYEETRKKLIEKNSRRLARLKLLSKEIEEFESLPPDTVTVEDLMRWNQLVVAKAEEFQALQTGLKPFQNQLNDRAVEVINATKEFGKKGKYAIIYDIGGFSSNFDPFTPDNEITLQMLDID